MRRGSLALVFAVLLLAGCGGGGSSSSNGAASKTPEQVIRDAKSAVDDASSVHISGNIVSGGTPIKLDLTLVRGKGATGSMSTNGLSFQLMRIGNKFYIQGSKAFYEHFAGAAAAQLLNGKWLEGTTTGRFSSLAKLTDAGKFFAQIGGSHGKLVNKGETTYQGQSVVKIVDSTKGGTLYVAATGPQYPVAIVGNSATHSGTISFDKWNETVSLTPPANAINIATLGAGG